MYLKPLSSNGESIVVSAAIIDVQVDCSMEKNCSEKYGGSNKFKR
jgi:hypothetical protein